MAWVRWLPRMRPKIRTRSDIAGTLKRVLLDRIGLVSGSRVQNISARRSKELCKVQLDWYRARLERRLDDIAIHFSNFLGGLAAPALTKEKIYELEGILSDVWQVWGRFCREVTMLSCTGCISQQGAVVPAHYPHRDNVSFVAWKQKGGVPPAAVGVNAILRKEPTWGHIDKLLEVIDALGPANAAKLKSAFGIVPKIEHVRLIRNAAAHRNNQTQQEVLSFQSQYNSFPIRHPLQALLWQDPGNNQILLISRMDDMRVAARNAVI